MLNETIILLGQIIELRENYFKVSGHEYHIYIEDIELVFDYLNKDMYIICSHKIGESVLNFLEGIENKGNTEPIKELKKELGRVANLFLQPFFIDKNKQKVL